MLKTSYLSVQYLDPVPSLTYSFDKTNAVIISDIDHNGYLDLVTFPSNFIFDTPINPVPWTNQGGIFTANPSVIKNTSPYQYFRDSVPGDFNNDGYTDYFQVDQGWELNNRTTNNRGDPALLLGGKNGLTWQNLDSWLTNTNGVRTFNHIADAADYDRDGDLDIVVACFFDFRIYQNSGLAKFTWREDTLPAKFNNYEYSVSGTSFIELNGQYAIVAGAYRTWPGDMKTLPLSVLTQQNGQFIESYTLARPNLGSARERNYGASDMFNMDLNGDGREDLLVVWETEQSGGIDDGLSNMSGTPQTARYSDLGNSVFSVYFQDASGKLVADNTFYNGDNTAGAPLFFEDFNLDGYVDFWISSYFARPTNFDQYVFINDGTGHFAHPKTPMFSTKESFPDWYTLSPFFFDANNDGAIDVVATRGVFPTPPSRTIGEEVRTFLSDSPAFNINGNNQFITTLANKTWDGGAGTDTAIFSGRFSDYTLTASKNNSWSTVDKLVGRDGQDSFLNIERLKFTDTNIALDISKDQTAGSSYMLYKAAFNRIPDASGLGYWINKMDTGMGYSDVAKNFVTSAEFKTAFGGSNPSVNTLVTKLYNNVLNRTPDAGGLSFWQDKLNTGLSTADVLGFFSTSAENVTNVTPLIANGISYTQFVG
jgi:hypothetical protein